MVGYLRCTFACLSVVLALIVWKFLSIWPQVGNTLCCYDQSWCKSLADAGSSLVSKLAHDCSHSHDLTSFDSKGYVVIQDFLSSDELAALKTLYHDLPNDVDGNGGDNIGYKTPALNNINVWHDLPSLHHRINNVTRRIALETATNPIDALDQFTKVGGFINTNSSVPGSVNFAWHQDHDSYFNSQNHNDYLNFYIMIEKSLPHEAGLEIVPWDRLLKKNMQMHELLLGKGATGFMPRERPQFFVDDEHDRCFKMGMNMNDVSCTPQLSPGDVIILRGDVLHRTQPHNSSRTAFSVRVHPQQQPFHLQRVRNAGYEYWRRYHSNPTTLNLLMVEDWQIDNVGQTRMDLIQKWINPDVKHQLMMWWGGFANEFEYRFRLACHKLFFVPLASRNFKERR